jgi:hypothetical protein
MKNAIIHAITYTFILILCFALDSVIEKSRAIIPLTFMFGWFTYPLIEYLKHKKQ